MEKYIIIAFNPDGTEDILLYTDDHQEAQRKLVKWRKGERKEWFDEGGEYYLFETLE